MKGTYYLHENGELIFKREGFEPELGNFVKRIWEFDTEKRFTAWIICIEALALGARKSRITELAEKWGLTDADAETFVEYSNGEMKLFMDGNAWCAVFKDFVNMQESQAGFGSTALEALSELAKPGLLEKRGSADDR